MQPSAAARARPQLGPVATFLRTLTELLLDLGPAKDAFQILTTRIAIGRRTIAGRDIRTYVLLETIRLATNSS